MSEPIVHELASEDVDTIRRAVERSVERVKRDALDEAARAALGAQLVALASHRSPKVRQAVAEAALHASDNDFERVVPDLLQDLNTFVRRAAMRIFDERSKRRRSEQLRDEQGAHIERLLAKLEKDHGKAARKAVDYICERKTEFFVQKMHHELAKVATSLKAGIVSVQHEARRAHVDGAKIAVDADAAFAKYELLMAIVDSARKHTELVPPKFKPESLRALAEEAVVLLRDRIGARVTRLDAVVDVDDALTIDADRGALMQALSNILQNAVEACPADSDSPIRVQLVARAQKAGTQVALAITDNGTGIAKGSLPHVVEPFCSGKPGGRGLGLTNARKMVESVHGGSLVLESERGVGTTVTIVLPRKQAKS